MRKLTRPRLLTAAVALGAALVAGVGGAAAGSADEHGAGTSTPHHASQIENLGLVKNQIKAYYGDSGDHQPSADSHYAHDVRRVERRLNTWLRVSTRHVGKPALILDVDDTVLSSYNYEVTHDFGYDPVSNGECVAAHCFPAIFGMPDLVAWAHRHHLAVIYITGRPGSQQQDTRENLVEQGYPTPDGLYTHIKQAPFPPYLTCAPNCSTIEYKSMTRAHVESMGYHIVATVGDQYSDLKGGHSGRTFKMPNPMYYLP